MLLIKNGYVMDPKTGRDGIYDILIKDDRIVKIQPFIMEFDIPDDEREDLQTIYADNMMIAPGLVDVHSHFRDPGFTYKEDIITGSKAAAAGGYTTVVLMANTKPVVDNEDTLNYILDKASQCDINVYTCASITKGLKGEELTDMDYLYDKGAVGFTDDGIPLMDEAIVISAMKKAAQIGVPLSFHEENPDFITNNGINHGKASAHYNIEGSPRAAEIDMVSRDIELAEKYNAPIDIQHISTREAVELIRIKKLEIIKKKNLPLPLPAASEDVIDVTSETDFAKSGIQIIPKEVTWKINIHGEATPHHFSLTEDAVIEHGTLAKMNPPLRTEKDRMAIIKGLKDNTIDIIATDHAPHSMEEKSKPITEAPSGIIGLETALPLAITHLVKAGHLSYMEMLEKLTINPAKMYNLDCGYIEEGGPADLVIFNERKHTVQEPVSKSSNSPFIGKELYGEVLYTICDGEVVYNNN